MITATKPKTRNEKKEEIKKAFEDNMDVLDITMLHGFDLMLEVAKEHRNVNYLTRIEMLSL